MRKKSERTMRARLASSKRSADRKPPGVCAEGRVGVATCGRCSGLAGRGGDGLAVAFQLLPKLSDGLVVSAALHVGQPLDAVCRKELGPIRRRQGQQPFQFRKLARVDGPGRLLQRPRRQLGRLDELPLRGMARASGGAWRAG